MPAVRFDDFGVAQRPVALPVVTGPRLEAHFNAQAEVGTGPDPPPDELEAGCLRRAWTRFQTRVVSLQETFGLLLASLPDSAGALWQQLRLAKGTLPGILHYLAHDPLFQFQQWQANLRILQVGASQTMLYVPVSNPYIVRLIGPLRREYWDRVLFWRQRNLEQKLEVSKIIAIGTASAKDWQAKPLTKWPTPRPHANRPTCGNTPGSHIFAFMGDACEKIEPSSNPADSERSEAP